MKTFTSAVLPLVLATAIVLSACGDKQPSGEVAGESAHAHEEGEEAGHDDHGAEGEHAGEGHSDVVKLTPEARKNAGIEVAPVGSGSISESIPLYGVLKPNAEAVRSVTARFPGLVRSVSAVIGQSVGTGTALATVESNESLQVYTVTSPLAGVVTERFTNVGEQAGAGPLFTVANLSTLWAELSLFPRDRTRIRVGQTVRIQVTDGEDGITGRVVFISPLGTSASQSLTARVVIDNKDGSLTPGLYVRGEVAVSETSVAMVVPVAALQDLEGGRSVFIEDEDGFEPRAVQVGRSDGRMVEIVGGLTPGERVVIVGSFVLKAELGKGEAEHEH